MNNILLSFKSSKIIIGLLLLPIIIPIYHSYGDQYDTIIYCLVAAALFFILAINAFKQQEHSFKPSILDILVLTIVLYVPIYQLIHGKYLGSQAISKVVADAIVYLFFKTLAEREEKRTQLFDIMLTLGTIEVLFVLVEILKIFSFFPNSVHTLNGTFGNPNVVAIFLAALIPLSFYRACSVTRYKYLYIVIALLFIIVIVYSRCRSAIILSIFTIISYSIYCYPKWNFKRLLLTCIISLGLIWALIFVNTQKRDSNISRMLIWKVSWNMIKDRPITGFGFTTFEKEYNLYQSHYLEKKGITQDEIYTSGYIRQPYSEYLYFWFTGGLVYLILYISLFGISGYHLIKSFTKTSSLLKFTSSVVLVGIFLISTFSYTFYLVIVEFFLFAHLGILSAFTSSVKATDLKSSILLLFFTVPTLFIGINSIKKLEADYQISSSINNKAIKNSKQLQAFKIYDHLNKENPQFLFNYALSLMKAKQFEEAIKMLNAAKKYSSYYQLYYTTGVCYELTGKPNDAEREYLLSSALYPSKYQPRFALFRLYLRLNNKEKAKIIAQKIDQMPLKVSSNEIKIIKIEIKEFLSK